MDELREAARGHREAHVRPGRGPAAGDQLRLQEGQRHRETAQRVRRSAWSRAATPSVRCAGWSTGTCGSTRRAEGGGTAMPIFIDRRLNPKDKSLGNRQRFLRRAREELSGAISEQIRSGKIADVGRRAARSRSRRGHRRAALPARPEQRPARPRAARQQGIPPGDRIQARPRAAAAAARAPPRRAMARTISASCCRARRCSTSSSRTSSCPIWSSSTSRKSLASSRGGPASPSTGSPTNINVGRTMRNSYGRRIALQRGPSARRSTAIRQEIAALEARPPSPDARQRSGRAASAKWSGCERKRRR